MVIYWSQLAKSWPTRTMMSWLPMTMAVTRIMMNCRDNGYVGQKSYKLTCKTQKVENHSAVHFSLPFYSTKCRYNISVRFLEIFGIRYFYFRYYRNFWYSLSLRKIHSGTTLVGRLKSSTLITRLHSQHSFNLTVLKDTFYVRTHVLF